MNKRYLATVTGLHLKLGNRIQVMWFNPCLKYSARNGWLGDFLMAGASQHGKDIVGIGFPLAVVAALGVAVMVGMGKNVIASILHGWHGCGLRVHCWFWHG